MASSAADSFEDFHLIHPDHYAARGYPHPAWTRLRREDPVHWFDRTRGMPFWAITRHADIVAIGKQPEKFLNGPRLVLSHEPEVPNVFPPTQIRLTFETRRVEGLYFAGQICGTSGYEEAAGQGLLAGINAVLALEGKEPLVLDRSQAFLGVLADDLVMECPLEPYRMFTSRAEYRLLLRVDNADLRLMEIGHRLGLIPAAAMRRVEEKRRRIGEAVGYLRGHRRDGKDLLQVLRRPEVTYASLAAAEPGLAALGLDREAAEGVEVEVKYEAYIERQKVQVEKFKRMESHPIPDDFDYGSVREIRAESREKLSRVRPRSLGQASRIAGVTPADLQVVVAHIEARRRRAGA